MMEKQGFDKMRLIVFFITLLFASPAFADHFPTGPTEGEDGVVMLILNIGGESYFDDSDIGVSLTNLNKISDTTYEVSSGVYMFSPVAAYLLDIEFIEPHEFSDCWPYNLADQADQAAMDAGIDTSWAKHVIYKISENVEHHGCTFRGQSSWWPFGYYDGRQKRSWVRGTNIGITQHELFHAVGWRHGTTDPNNDGIPDTAYGDSSSVMGGATYTSCLNAVNLAAIGWHIPTQITESGIYTIPHLYSSTTGTILKVERFLLDEGGPDYYLSFRKPNFSCEGPATQYTQRFFDGVSIHSSKKEDTESLLIRPTTPNGLMTDGSVFADGNVTITQTESTGDYVTVLIDFGDYQEPPPPPIIIDECEVEGKPSRECWCKEHPNNKKCK